MKTLKFVALSLLLLSGILCLAAQSGYVYSFAYPDVDQQASSSVFLCSDNSIVVFSHWDTYDFVNTSGSKITKLDPQGEFLWSYPFASGSWPNITGVDIDEDDNVTFIYSDAGCCRLCKVSSSGIVSDISEPVSLPKPPMFSKALRTPNGDIVAVGSALWSYNMSFSNYCTTYCRFSAQGDTLATANWYNTHYNMPKAHDLSLLDNGNLLLTCVLGVGGSTILEINLAGEVINRYDIPPTYDPWYGITIGDEPDSQSHIIAYGVDNGVSVDRFNGGNLEHLFDIPSSIMDNVSSMLVTTDNIFLCGARGAGGSLVKLDWDGSVIWTWSQSGGNMCEYVIHGGGMPKSLLAIDNSDCIYWAWGGSNRLVVTKLLPNGQVANQDPSIPAPHTKISHYPNPVTAKVTIKYATEQLQGNLEVEFYNIRGQKLLSVPINDHHSSGEIELDPALIQARKSGVYLYVLKSGGKKLATGRMALIK